jgi:hypothetical protein
MRLERERQGEDATLVAASTGATALEVAGLRERLDGVTMKLGDIERHVGVLEAVPEASVTTSDLDLSGKPTPAAEMSDAPAVVTSAQMSDRGASDPSPGGVDPHSETRRADVDVTVETPPLALPHEPSPVVLMLTDGQFQQWLDGGRSPNEHGSSWEDRRGDWRSRRNTATATRRGLRGTAH